MKTHLYQWGRILEPPHIVLPGTVSRVCVHLTGIHSFPVHNTIRTTPAMQKNTATSFDSVNRSPFDDGYMAANTNVKNVDVELSNDTNAVSFGSKANWNK